MPRESRKISESKIYHVMERGNERRTIFLDDEDRMRFLETLLLKNQDKLFSVYAYCLMDNHVHLLINEGEDSIGRIMKRINTSYAHYFNQKYSRVGHLFQDRFKSEPVEEESYLLAAIRYIHQNPVKAGIVKRIQDYRWSSYGEYLGKNNLQNKVIDKEFILEIFNKDEQKAINAFVKYIEEQCEDQFLDIKEKAISTSEALEVINAILQKNKMSLDSLKSCNNIDLRSKLIIEIREKTKLSIRKMAQLLNMNKDAINKIIR